MTMKILLKGIEVPAIRRDVMMVLFPDQQAAWTGVQQSMEQRLFGSAPSLMSSLARSEWPKNAAQKRGVCPALLVNSTETPPVKTNDSL